MADKKISALTAATTPLAGTEVLPIVQSGSTVKVTNNDLRPKQIQSNATSGVLQIVGPAAASTRVMTTPDANFTAARTDAAQSFTGDQTLDTGDLILSAAGKGTKGDGGAFLQAYGLVAAAGYVDLSINPNGFAGILSVSATRGNYNPQSTRTVFAATCYGTTLTTTSLHTQDGSGGSNSFSVTCPSAGVVRITDTSGYGSPTAIYVTFHGAFNYLYA